MLFQKINFFHKVCLTFFFMVNCCGCDAKWTKKHLSRRIAVAPDTPSYIDLNGVDLIKGIIVNIGLFEINYSIKVPKEDEPLEKGVVKNGSSTFVKSHDGLPEGSQLYLYNNCIETAIVYVTIWFKKFHYEVADFDPESLNLPTEENPTFYKFGSNHSCQTPIIEKTELTWYEKHTNNLGTRDYAIIAVNMIPFLGPVIDPLLETFWLYDSGQYRDGPSLFQSILHDLNNFLDRMNHDNLYKQFALGLKQIHQKLFLLIKNVDASNENNTTKIEESEETLNLTKTLITEQYIGLVEYVKGMEVGFMPVERRRHIYLEVVCNFTSLQMKIFNIGLIQTQINQEIRKKILNRGINLLIMEGTKYKLYLEQMKNYVKYSVINFNVFVQDTIDNLYKYAYEDSLVDHNVYNAVVKAHNMILNYGIKPLHNIVQNMLEFHKIPIDFQIADFQKPYLYFSPIFGSSTLESARQASIMVNNLYSIPSHKIARSVSNVDVQFNAMGEITALLNHDGEIISPLDRELFEKDSNLYFFGQRINKRIPLINYIQKVEICLERISVWLTKIKHVQFYSSNGKWIDLVVATNKSNLICNTFELKHHSVYRLTIFTDGCTNNGNAVGAAVVYKHLDNSNQLMSDNDYNDLK